MPFSSYTDFLMATREIPVAGQDEILMEIDRNTYLLKDMLKGRGNDDVFSGGKKLVDFILPTTNGSAQDNDFDDELTIVDSESMKETEAYWRLCTAHFTYNEIRRALNEGDDSAFFTLKKRDVATCWGDLFNKLEDDLIAVPNVGGMEGSDGLKAYSIPTFITENGLAPTGFTNIHGINPATQTWWRNQVSTYDPSKIATADDPDNLIAAFDDMFLEIKFDRLNASQVASFYEDDQLSKLRILSNKDGVKTLKRIVRAENDRLTPANDLDNSPRYNGYPVEYISGLNTAALYTGSPAGASSHSNGVAAAGYPRFHFCNFRYMKMFFHSSHYLQTSEPIMVSAKKPFSKVVYVHLLRNMFCRSRRRQGIVRPKNAS